MTVNLAGARWFKSSHSGGGGDCLEIAWLEQGNVGVRDSKDPTGHLLLFSSAEWTAFTGRIRKHPGPRPSH